MRLQGNYLLSWIGIFLIGAVAAGAQTISFSTRLGDAMAATAVAADGAMIYVLGGGLRKLTPQGTPVWLRQPNGASFDRAAANRTGVSILGFIGGDPNRVVVAGENAVVLSRR